MKLILCPSCKSNLPPKAAICTGCHGRVVYGLPYGERITALVTGLVAGGIMGFLLFSLLAFIANSKQGFVGALPLSFSCGVTVGVLRVYVLRRKYRDRVTVYSPWGKGM